jgi:uncharacterized protein YjbI with pentapeptide repeats
MPGIDRSRNARITRALRRREGKEKMPPIAKKADDLEAIKQAVEGAAVVSGGLWLSYLFLMFYLAIAAGAVTHADLFVENPVKLPFLAVELPLKVFFFLAPILFVITHTYTLSHFVLLADKAKLFHFQLRKQIKAPDNDSESGNNEKAAEIRTNLRRQLPINIFVQFLAGPEDIRESGLGFLLKLIAWATLVVAPMLLILLLQIQFLPYHEAWITWIHRLALLAELLIVWWLWRAILSGGGSDFRRRSAFPSWLMVASGIASSVAAVLFSWTVATFPGEWNEGPLSFVAPIEPVSINAMIVCRRFEYTLVFHGLGCLSNTLSLPRFNIFEALKLDDPKKAEWRSRLFSFRGRDLRGAELYFSVLPKVSFVFAQLQGAMFDGAQLQGATFHRAHLEGADFAEAQLQGASFPAARLLGASMYKAHLQGALFGGADLRGVKFSKAHLEAASFPAAHLEGALFDGAYLQGASLSGAKLLGASLKNSYLTATDLGTASMWRADFDGAELKSLYVTPEALRWATVESDWDGSDLTQSATPWMEKDYLDLKKNIEHNVEDELTRTRALKQIERLRCENNDNQLAPCNSEAVPSTFPDRIKKAAVDERSYSAALTDSLVDTICSAGSGAVYILRSILRPLNPSISVSRINAQKFDERLGKKDCPVSAHLTEDDKADLHALVKAATPPAVTDRKSAE